MLDGGLHRGIDLPLWRLFQQEERTHFHMVSVQNSRAPAGPEPHEKLDTRVASLLSIVVPVYNEGAGLHSFHSALNTALVDVSAHCEIVYVDDGSGPETSAILEAIRQLDSRVAVATLSRNFGKEAAMTAGLHLAKGDALILIDADLQDPPRLIPSMVEAWRDGADVVAMRRRSRSGEGWFKIFTAFAFYRVFNLVSDTPMPADVGDFRLMSRQVVDAINRLPERNRFMKGIFAWVGFRTVTIEYDRHARQSGVTKLGVRKLWRFAVEGIVGFSTVPLRLATYVGTACAVASFLYAMYFFVKTALFGDPIHGFPTLIISVLILGGLQLTAIGILGEYVSRLFVESKARPLYLLRLYQPAGSPPAPWVSAGRQ